MSLPFLSVAQMREWEQATWASGQTEDAVIRRVGESVARRSLQMTAAGDFILLLAGKGHNGDDVRAAQPHLAGRRVELLDVTDPEEALGQLGAALARCPALVVDGLFGIGLNRPLDAAWIRLIDTLNAAPVRVLSVDVPSGLNADTGSPFGNAVQAGVTLTVGAPKMGMIHPDSWPYVGRLEVAGDTGLLAQMPGSEWRWTEAVDFKDMPPRRSVSGHKGTYGHLAIIAGSVGFHGAAVLAARGAQRARPGLISLFTPPECYVPVASQLQSVMVHPWEDTPIRSADFSAVVMGPGMASPDVPGDLIHDIRRLWMDAEVPVIADASALDWLPAGSTQRNAVRVVTPHPGEAGRLSKLSSAQVLTDRKRVLRQVSEKLGGAWVVLKGHQTLVGRNEGEIHVNSSGGPDLAQGGSGDLLAGYLAGLLAQPGMRRDPLLTIRYAVWQHGACADALSHRKPNWTIEELADELGLQKA